MSDVKGREKVERTYFSVAEGVTAELTPHEHLHLQAQL